MNPINFLPYIYGSHTIFCWLGDGQVSHQILYQTRKFMKSQIVLVTHHENSFLSVESTKLVIISEHVSVYYFIKINIRATLGRVRCREKH